MRHYVQKVNLQFIIYIHIFPAFYNISSALFLCVSYRIISTGLYWKSFYRLSLSQSAGESVDKYSEWQSNPRWLTSCLNPDQKLSGGKCITSFVGHLSDISFMSIIIFQRRNKDNELAVESKCGTECDSESLEVMSLVHQLEMMKYFQM